MINLVFLFYLFIIIIVIEKVNVLLEGLVRACILLLYVSGAIKMLALNLKGENFNDTSCFFHLAEWHPLE